MRAFVVLGAMILCCIATTASAKPAFPHSVGECSWIHGYYVIANGSGVRRIVIRGTSHIVNLADSDREIPETLKSYENHSSDLFARSGKQFDPALYGDFKVCASKRYIRGHMQLVRIKQTRRLILGGRSYNGESWWRQ